MTAVQNHIFIILYQNHAHSNFKNTRTEARENKKIVKFVKKDG